MDILRHGAEVEVIAPSVEKSPVRYAARRPLLQRRSGPVRCHPGHRQMRPHQIVVDCASNARKSHKFDLLAKISGRVVAGIDQKPIRSVCP